MLLLSGGCDYDDASSNAQGASAATGGQGGAGNTPAYTLDLRDLQPEALALPEPDSVEAAKARALGILATLSQEEKLALVQGTSGAYVGNVPAVAGVPPLSLQDGPAGVARFTGVTQFPAPIALAASWDVDLVRRWGAAMGAEERAKGAIIQLGPMMNLARVPRAGRNFEGFGEDPYLCAELAAADVTGIQSNKVVATAKHFVGNEQETQRMGGNSRIDERTLHEVYYAPFEASVSAGVGAVMCSYNRLNGHYACENATSLGDLKDGMGFSGWVMSDWDATTSLVESANAGLDMEMPSGRFFGALSTAIAEGSVAQSRLDDMVTRILTSLVRVGALDDPPSGNPASSVPDHSALALEAATAGITLLKNEGGALPLDPSVTSIAVIGTAGDLWPATVGTGSAEVLGSYAVSPFEAIGNRAGAQVTVTYTQGNDLSLEAISDAAAAAAAAEVAIVFLAPPTGEGLDRSSIGLSQNDQDLLAAVTAASPRTVLVLNAPGAMTVPLLDQLSALLVAWLPGQENGNAITQVLFGDVNPSGKLPVTFPVDESILPLPGDGVEVSYDEGLAIGYRGFDALDVAPQFPFGYGLSYTTYAYRGLELRRGASPSDLEASFEVENTGSVRGTETAELYLGFPPTAEEPPRVLRGFARVALDPGERKMVTLQLPPRALSCWNAAAHTRYVPSGTYRLFVGSSSRDLPLETSFEVLGVGPQG